MSFTGINVTHVICNVLNINLRASKHVFET